MRNVEGARNGDARPEHAPPAEAPLEAAPAWRYRVSRAALRVAVRAYARYEVEGIERLPGGAAVLCFNHLSWADPLFLIPAIPDRRIFFVGPEQEDMQRGARNRLMTWAGIAVAFKPRRRGLVAAVRRAEALAEHGELLAIAGEGRIHAGERALLPLNEGAAYLALRCGVPLVPVAINGTGWLGFRRRVRVRVGEPIERTEPSAAGTRDLEPGSGNRIDSTPSAEARPQSGASVALLTRRLSVALLALVADFPDAPPPGPVGRWLTELFNDWPEGARPPVPPGPPDRV